MRRVWRNEIVTEPAVGLPDDFLWGAATAAHQIEGNNINADLWTAEQAGTPPFTEPSGDACDSYHRYREDIQLLAEAGLKVYRFSIEWARIEPTQGRISRAQLLHYRDMIDACHELGVIPFVTLHHFTSPRWFAEGGGLRSPDAVERFTAYVEAACEILHDVRWVVTINEPNIWCLFDALTSTTGGPVTIDMASLPGPDPKLAQIMVGMHRAAVKVIRARTTAKVGWAIAAQAFTPTAGNEAAFDRVFQQWEGVFYDATDGDDFIGIQSYTSQPVDANGPVPHPDDPTNTLTGWAYRPDALGINLGRIWQLKGVPLMVTENGIATDDDTRRISYTRDALLGLKQAVAAGAQVLGYLHWSLLDNYEWGSYRPTFGLIAVDRAGKFARTPKPSLAWLGRVVASNGADLEYE
jgi:beta-glucosidase